MTFAAQPKNEIRPRHAAAVGAAARDAAQRDSNKFALLQHPDKRNRSHVKNWGQHQEKYGFSFKPGHAAQKGDRTDAATAVAAKMKTKTKSKSAICKGIKHFDQAINSPRSMAWFMAWFVAWWGWQTICLYGFYCFPTRKDQNKNKKKTKKQKKFTATKIYNK